MRKEQSERPVIGLDIKCDEIMACGMFLARYILLSFFHSYVSMQSFGDLSKPGLVPLIYPFL